ncbi:hypothetical protein J3R73_002440 [Labrys monachus]|uniref:Maturase K n=2 Tax=Labrys monachus TaxID=217067 RepID=A0ABU0FDG7_9HYPH|nr:hypothetical protein [Labrys monachus]
MTNYESLYQIKGLIREEAHLIILPEVLGILRSWQ